MAEARKQWRRIERSGCAYASPAGPAEALRNRQLCFAHMVYLHSISFALDSGVGSRGSAIVLDRDGTRIHDGLGDEWRIEPENTGFREKVLETWVGDDGTVVNEWVDRRPIPDTDAWFETAWAQYRDGEIFD